MLGKDRGEAQISIDTDDYGRLLQEVVVIRNESSGRSTIITDWYYRDEGYTIRRVGFEPYTIEVDPAENGIDTILDPDEGLPRTFELRTIQKSDGSTFLVCERKSDGTITKPLEKAVLNQAGRVIRAGEREYIYNTEGLLTDVKLPNGFRKNEKPVMELCEVVRIGRSMSVAVGMLEVTIEYDSDGRPVHIVEDFRGYDMGNTKSTYEVEY
jgi:hypothetical protein